MVHEIDLKRWALKKANDLFDTTFTGSDNWVRQFKIRHNTVSRKITKREIDDSDKIHQSADKFVSNMQKISCQYPSKCILNTDPCGLQLKMFSNRTLNHQHCNFFLNSTFQKIDFKNVAAFSIFHYFSVQFRKCLIFEFIEIRFDFRKKFIFQKMENQPWLWITFENQFRFRPNDMNNDRYVTIVDSYI